MSKNPESKNSDYFVPWLENALEYNIDILDTVWAHPEIARLMLNENPIPPSEKVINAVTDICKYGNRYPDRWWNLREKIGKSCGFGAKNVFLANGSSEVIDNMMRVFLRPGDEVLLATPTFTLFRVRASVCGGVPVEVPLRESDLQYDIDAMLAAITPKTKLIVIVNPNNPTGIFIEESDLRRILDTGIPTCIDEAYLAYHPEVPSQVKLVKEYPNAFTSHTLSKAHGIAGMRFGYMIANEDIVKAFEQVSLPWNLSLMNLAAGEAILEDTEHVEKMVKHNNDWMDRYYKEFTALGLKPFKAHGNYMLVDANDFGLTSEEIYDKAMEDNVAVKVIEPIHGKAGYFRVTPGTDEENERCLKAMRRIFGGKGPLQNSTPPNRLA